MFTHTGIVDDVFAANTPDANVPAQKVVVNVAASDVQPAGKEPTFQSFQPQVAFFIPVGTKPDRGEAISWGPHHAWWVGEKVDKLTLEMEP